MVKFDHGNVRVPGFGNFPVQSEYPRLKPKFERNHVEDRDLDALCSTLLLWVNDNFVTAGREKYFKELTFSTVLFVIYMNPLPELYSEEMFLGLKIFFWLWYADDVYENVIENKIHFKELQRVTDQLHSILTGKFDNSSRPVDFEIVPNYPIFGQLFDSLLQLHDDCRKRLPDYGKRVKNLFNDLQRYFTALRWFCIDEIDERYSEESFKTFRRSIAFFDGIADVVALIHGVTLSDEITNSLTMKRLLDIANSFGAYTNDMLGMKKELANGQKDNLIVFLVLKKKVPIDVAVRQTCEFLVKELDDYYLVKAVILKEFDYDENLIKYLDILDSLIDGHNVMYLRSKRHLTAGAVSLTR